MLRAFRSFLQDRFAQSRLSKGRHHWSNDRLFKQGKLFLLQILKSLENFDEPTETDVWALVTLIYPAKAKVSRENGVAVAAVPELYKVLGDDKIALYKDIFANNNSSTITRFFSDPFIVKLWPLIRKSLKYEDCFGKTEPNSAIFKTYR